MLAMSTYKTKVEATALQDICHELDLPENIELEEISGGEGSQAYGFESASGPKILRINAHSNEGFYKDKLAYEHFASASVPIPKIDKIGELASGLYFAISDRVGGVPLETEAKSDEIESLKSAVIHTMDAIHMTAPIGEGYGFIKLDGNGKNKTWHEAMDADQADEDDPSESNLAACEFFDAQIYASLRTKIKNYYRYCPNDIRQLVHRDYGFGNTLTDGQSVTGVIDWNSCVYGDPMYDVAWLDFWAPLQDWSADIKKYYEGLGRVPENFDYRLTCYKLIIGTNSMAFFAKSEQLDAYNWTRDQVAAL